MLAGHFCTVSGNWPFAIEEYKRALIQRPNDQVTALCLATSYFNSLSSRAVEVRCYEGVVSMRTG